LGTSENDDGVELSSPAAPALAEEGTLPVVVRNDVVEGDTIRRYSADLSQTEVVAGPDRFLLLGAAPDVSGDAADHGGLMRNRDVLDLVFDTLGQPLRRSLMSTGLALRLNVIANSAHVTTRVVFDVDFDIAKFFRQLGIPRLLELKDAELLSNLITITFDDQRPTVTGDLTFQASQVAILPDESTPIRRLPKPPPW